MQKVVSAIIHFFKCYQALLLSVLPNETMD
jgi:hypothetical protein